MIYEEDIEVAIKKRQVKNWLEETQTDVLAISKEDDFIQQSERDILTWGDCVGGDTDFIFRSDRTWDEIVADYTNSLDEDWRFTDNSSSEELVIVFKKTETRYTKFMRIYRQENNTYRVGVAITECWEGA